MIGVPVTYCHSPPQAKEATLEVGFGPVTNGTLLRFRDSRDVPWSGTPLSIVLWDPSTNTGPDHIYIGTNAQGATAAQLGQLNFVDPIGWPPGKYPAKILATGEIVPAVPPDPVITSFSNRITVSWSGAYELWAATNVLGPFVPVPSATSPYTNSLSGSQRYFRLKSP